MARIIKIENDRSEVFCRFLMEKIRLLTLNPFFESYLGAFKLNKKQKPPR